MEDDENPLLKYTMNPPPDQEDVYKAVKDAQKNRKQRHKDQEKENRVQHIARI